LILLLLSLECVNSKYEISWDFISGSEQPNFQDSFNRIPAGRWQGGLTVGSTYIWLYGGVNYHINPTSPRNQYFSDLYKITIDDDNYVSWDFQKILTSNGISIADVTGSLGHCKYDNQNFYPPMLDAPCVWSLNDNLYVFGGSSYELSNGKVGFINYDDSFWEFNPATGNWTRLSGSGLDCFSNDPYLPTPPLTRHGAVYWKYEDDFYMFGGKHYYSFLNDVWKYSTSDNTWIQVNENQPNSDTYPRARAFTTNWSDSRGNLWIYGGKADNGATLGDLWMMSPDGKWKHISGDTSNNIPSYHTDANQICKGNTPGSREGAITWVDDGGRVLLLGGGYANLIYDDLWLFDPSVEGWAWLTENTTLGARKFANSWVDSKGNFWMFGGEFANGGMADLWQGKPSGSVDYCGSKGALPVININ